MRKISGKNGNLKKGEYRIALRVAYFFVTTPNHPFWVVNKGWIEAAELNVGDILTQYNGSYVLVTDISIELLDSPIKVYNFEVEDWHTYFVGSEKILVHNMCAKEFIKSPKNAKQVISYLKKQGFKEIRQSGSHKIFSDWLNTVTVPFHGSKDIAIGTLKSIMKQAGLL